MSMTSHRVSLVIIAERANVHPLHLSIPASHAKQIGVNLSDREQAFIAGLSSNILPQTIFVHVRIESTPGVNVFTTDANYHGLEVACTERFLRHYNLQSFCDTTQRDIDKDETNLLFFRCIHTLELSKIIIAVKNENVYRSELNLQISKNLTVSMSQGPVLARANDVLLAPYNDISHDYPPNTTLNYFGMVLLECIPYKQGIITGNTQLVLMMSANPDLYSRCLGHSNREDEMTSSGDEIVEAYSAYRSSRVLVSRFTQPLSGTSKRSPRKSYPVKINIVPKQAIWSRILAKSDTSVHFDDMYLIGFPKSLMIKYELFDGNHVKVCLQEKMKVYTNEPVSNLHKKKCNFHIAQVKMLKRNFDQSSDVFISPLLHFNMLINIPWHGQILFFQKCDVQPQNEAQPPHMGISPATEVQVCLITTPDCNSKAMYHKVLKQYFSKRRVVTDGDVISVTTQEDPDLYQNLSEGIKYRQPVVHFRVIHIDPENSQSVSFFVDQTTTLIQVGSGQGFTPSCMSTYLSPGEEMSYFEKDKLQGIQQYVDQVRDLIEPYLQLSCNPAHFKGDNLQPTVLVCGQDGSGKTSVIFRVAKLLHMSVYSVNCQRLCCDTQSATETKIKNAFSFANTYAPCVLLLENVHMLGKDRDGRYDDPRVAKTFADFLTQTSLMSNKYPVVVMATSSSPNKIAHDIMDCFLHCVTIETPNESERTQMIGGLVADLPLTSDVDISYISNRTAGFVLGDFHALLSQVSKQALRRIHKLFSEVTPDQERDIEAAGVLLQHNDFTEALDVLQSAHSDSMGTPKIPNVKWQDIGGLSHIKSDILDTIQLPLRYPKLLAAGLKRSGILLYGPPGSGKTLLAKAVATECSLNFLSVKGPELINQYVGQSEENVRDVFTRARDASPCVIFFDELDSLAPNRGRSGDSGGVMDRVVSQLLAELDGLHKSAEVFVIGATNRPDLLDPALLRPGRFDKLLYLGVSEDRPTQVKILKALTRKFHLDDDVDLVAISELCPLNLTGADLYALCSDAMLNAIKLKVIHLRQYESPASADCTVIVTKADFTDALVNLTPSVSPDELERYSQLRQTLSPPSPESGSPHRDNTSTLCQS